jgi:hypothetical protein
VFRSSPWAGGTAVVGVLYALMQTDLKRALASSTIENIGLVFIGPGLALAFEANGLGTAGALALTATLFHVVNHMLFKSQLFFGAGAVLVATGARMMEHFGGLIRRMPVTSTTFLVGSAAIAALPPLNGFASERLLLQAILLSPQFPQWGLKLLLVGVGALLALSTALARQFGCGGYVGRASGRCFDARRALAYPPYDTLSFEVPCLEEGEVNARVWIRIREVEQSLALLAQILSRLPRDGALATPVGATGKNAEGLAIVEGFRGDVLASIRLDRHGRVERCHLRDPSWFQWPVLEATIENNIVADFPLCNKSFNCSYSGHDL